jgi:hypothetical protein
MYTRPPGDIDAPCVALADRHVCRIGIEEQARGSTGGCNVPGDLPPGGGARLAPR